MFQRYTTALYTYARHLPLPVRRVLRHPAGLALTVFAVLMLVAAGVIGALVYRGGSDLTVQNRDTYIAIISYDGNKKVVPTNAKTVAELLERMHIVIEKGDRVEPDVTERITQDKFLVNVYRAAPVTVYDAGNAKLATSAAATPRGLVEQAGVQLYPEDIVITAPTDNFVLEGSVGLRATVDRATPVGVALYGAPPVTMRTRVQTVGEFIKEKHIIITHEDTVKPGVEMKITAGMAIAVIRNGIHTITVTEDIAPPENITTDSSLSLGATAVRQEGTPGKKNNTYQITVENGEEVSRTLLQSVTVVEPVARLVVRGTAVYVAPDKTAVMAAAGISPTDYGAVDYIVSRESGWCPTKLQGTHDCPAAAPGYYPGGLGYGLVQSTPAGKMASAGADWETNPVTQLRWATGYASRYGGWQGAYEFWVQNRWW